jgi:RNA polymerase sigma factor for flagellar operon FliA
MNTVKTGYEAYRPEPLSDDELVRRHAPCIDRLARLIARRAPSQALEGDLWSAGALGLIEAARRFDPSRGIKFETFIEHRIRGAMLDELRRMDHLPRRLRSDCKRVAEKRQALSQTLQRPATSEEVAGALGIALEELHELEALAQPVVPLSDPDLLCRSGEPSPEDVAIRRRLSASLQQAVSRLPERLQLVLSLYYGEGCTYREIAGMLKVSEPRICQIHGEAVGKLRADMKAAAS